MVKALIDISDSANRVISVVKAEYGLKDKSQAINVMAREYEELIFEPRVKASYLKRLKKIQKEHTVKMSSMDGFDRMFGLKK